MFAAVALGAFGAHALKARLAPELLTVWQTAVQYHAWHALALLAAGLWLRGVAEPPRSLVAGAWLLLAGIVLFSGSLYALALSGWGTFGAVTPFGGVAWLAAWALLAHAAWRGMDGTGRH